MNEKVGRSVGRANQSALTKLLQDPTELNSSRSNQTTYVWGLDMVFSIG